MEMQMVEILQNIGIFVVFYFFEDEDGFRFIYLFV